MRKQIKLDPDTLRFASGIAWQFAFTCKNTKEGRIKAGAYHLVQDVLEHYIQLQNENPDRVVEVEE